MQGNWARHAVLWLLPVAIAVFAVLATAGALCTTRRADTRTYELSLAGESLPGILAWHRAIGYPTVLELAGRVPRGFEFLPHAQLGVFFLAVLAFAAALRLYYRSELVAYLGALPLLVAPLAWRYAATVLSDVIAAALSLVTVALLFVSLGRPRRWSVWAALAASLFLTYQVRPAYLFLLGAMPLLGFLWIWRRRGGPWWEALRSGPVVAVCFASALPFLGWSSLRAVTVGHFGTISFGGMNIIGIASSKLQPGEVARLPKEQRPLAEAILARREYKGVKVSLHYDYSRWARQYNPNIWQVAVPAALRLARERESSSTRLAPPPSVEANRQLTRISWALIRLHPADYLRWIRDSLGHSFGSLAGEPVLRWSGLLLVLAAGVSRWSRRGSAPPATAEREPLREAAADLGLLAVVYLVLALALVVVVEYPLERYVLAAALFLPSPVFVLSALLLCRPPLSAARESAP